MIDDFDGDTGILGKKIRVLLCRSGTYDDFASHVGQVTLKQLVTFISFTKINGNIYTSKI